MPGIEGFELPKSLEIDEATRTDTFARFTAEPWEHGFGNTIGNALRRVLLSSMEGVAVTSIRISYEDDNGQDVRVPHEFTTIPDVLEDVTQIVLNVKKLKFLCDGELPRTLQLVAEHAGPVTGENIRVDDKTTVLTQDQLICTLDKDRAFRMELDIDRGRGYRRSELNKHEDQALLTIPVDSLFSPVERVSYEVQACRKNNIMDMDRLELSVWTDGRIRPQDAVKLSAQILMKHLELFVGEIGEAAAEVSVLEAPQALSPENEALADKLSAKVETLQLSVRAANVMQALQVTTLADMVSRTDQDLLKHRNCGKKTVQEIKESLQKLDLYIGMEIPEEVKQEVARRQQAETTSETIEE